MPIEYLDDLPDDRRALNPKRDSDVSSTEFPVLSQSVYLALTHGDASKAKKSVLCLSQGRNSISQAIHSVGAAMHHYGPDGKWRDKKVWNGLVAVHKNLEKAWLKYPLRVEGK